MGDRLSAGIPPRYVTKPTRSTQPCIPMGSLNRVPALIGWGKSGNVTSAGWQVILCDPIWHVSYRSGAVLVAQTAIRFLTLHIEAFTRLKVFCVQFTHEGTTAYSITAKLVFHSIVTGYTARLDYCNSQLHGTSVKNVNRLQLLRMNRQFAVLRGQPVPLRSEVSSIGCQKINYKLALLTYKTRSIGRVCYIRMSLQGGPKK